MKNYKRIYLLLLVGVVLVSCKEETRVNTVEGFLYHDCSFPLGGTEVAFKANKGTAFTEPLILATDICDASGYFRFTYELEEDKSGTADLIIVEEVGYSTVLASIPLNKDQQLRPYRNNLSTVIFNYTGQKVFQPTDTLFYGMQYGVEKYKIQPVVGFSDTLYTRLPNTIDPSRWTAFYYGAGSGDFKLSKEALTLQDSSYNHVWIQAMGCGDVDQFNLWIN